MSQHAMELTAARINWLGRLLEGADSITFDRFGEVTIQGKADNLRPLPDMLGLTRTPDHDHGYADKRFRIWEGETFSPFGRFPVRLVLVSDVEQLPCDCHAADLQ